MTALILNLLGSSVAMACTVCGGGSTEDSKDAFVLTTVVLSAVPVASISGLLLYLRARLKKRDDA